MRFTQYYIIVFNCRNATFITKCLIPSYSSKQQNHNRISVSPASKSDN